MTSRLFLCNFSLPNVYQTFFFNVCVGQTNCFYFCPHFYENFISGRILHQAIERKNEVCCCCLMCRTKLCPETNFSDEAEEYFYELKKLLIQYYYVFDSSAFLAGIP